MRENCSIIVTLELETFPIPFQRAKEKFIGGFIMKKIIALLLALTMVFALVACASTEKPAETPADNQETEKPAENTFHTYT